MPVDFVAQLSNLVFDFFEAIVGLPGKSVVGSAGGPIQ